MTGNNFSTAYEYDNIGRLISKNENGISHHGYNYQEGTSALKSVNAHTDEDNYLYNKNGSMVVDKSKKMIIHYNWNSKPETIYFYNTLPDDVEDLWRSEDLTGGNIQLLKTVVMIYDANGNRVQKLLYDVENGVQ